MRLRSFSKRSIPVAVACLVSLVAAVPATAESDPAGMAVDHSGETHTLDGKSVSQQVAMSDGQACAAIPDVNGVVPCFTSPEKMGGAQAKALRKGEVPAGYGALPPEHDRQRHLELFEQKAAGNEPPDPTADSGGGGFAAMDGYDCNHDATKIWRNANFVDSNPGYMGYTGNTYWRNYSSSYDNQVSSFWAKPGYTTRWHDYAYGGGAYYGNGYSCRFVEDLRNADMTDGGTANDRFSSWLIY